MKFVVLMRIFTGSYLFSVATSVSDLPSALTLMLMLSVTLSSLLLAPNIIIRLPIPIPTGLFDVHAEPPLAVLCTPFSAETLTGYGTDYRRSGSITVVGDRHSGDIWNSMGDAVGVKGKVGLLASCHPS